MHMIYIIYVLNKITIGDREKEHVTQYINVDTCTQKQWLVLLKMDKPRNDDSIYL